MKSVNLLKFTVNGQSECVQQRGQPHSIPDHTGYDPPVPVAANVGINQKLDRLLTLIEKQKRETAAIKSEMANLKEVDSYRSAVSSTATIYNPPTPSVTKLPLELLVSENMISIVKQHSGVCLFFPGCRETSPRERWSWC